MRARMYRQAQRDLGLADLGVEKTMFQLDRDSDGAGVAYIWEAWRLSLLALSPDLVVCMCLNWI